MFSNRFRNALIVAGTAVVGLSIWAVPVAADNNMDLEFEDDSGEIGVDYSDEQPGSGGSSDDGAASGGDESGGGTSVPTGTCPNYAYELTDSESGFYKGSSAGERPSDEHQLLGRWCREPDTGTMVAGAEWVLPGEDGAPIIDPRILAQQAVDSLQLPRPRIAASPEAAQLVRLPVWLWLEGASWETQSASASVPGLTVTATAVPVEATWKMGDGATVDCSGPGTVWEKGMDAEAASPDCGHTYTQPSAEELKARVTVTWEVTWSGGGESGSVPAMVTTASVSWPVVESHALVTR